MTNNAQPQPQPQPPPLPRGLEKDDTGFRQAMLYMFDDLDLDFMGYDPAQISDEEFMRIRTAVAELLDEVYSEYLGQAIRSVMTENKAMYL